jgi:SNF2 family DNA or RNA helicase
MIIKMKAGDYRLPVEVEREGSRFFLEFPYNEKLLDEIKCMKGAKWHGYDAINPRKCWSIEDCPRNHFQLSYLAGENPYAPYRTPLSHYVDTRPIYEHQGEMTDHFICRRQCVCAGEMGVGKTLAAIRAMEAVQAESWIWVGPRSALESVRLEFLLWKAKVWPEFYTYEGLRDLMENWPAGKQAPRGLVGDEISRCKNPTAKRSQAVRHLADSMRKEYGRDAYIFLMSGSPAPKSPADWWNICEIACPGFLKEGDIHKFKQRLALVENVDSVTGGTYPKLIAWRDSVDRCNVCGRMIHETIHDMTQPGSHIFIPGKDEVSYLYKRMKGLVLVKLKKDCLDLPEKRYKTIKLKPSLSILQAAKLITARSPRTITALTLLRELSDGFQYVSEEAGTEVCERCNGSCKEIEYFDTVSNEILTEEEVTQGFRLVSDDDWATWKEQPVKIGKRDIDCGRCDATGVQVKYNRETKQVPCPKEDALKSILEDHEEIGRLVVYAGFKGSVDRCVEICKRMQWEVIRVDGRGWWSSVDSVSKAGDMITLFQKKQEDYARVVFIGQPGAAGMGLTLTASPTIVYYSNDFNAESRSQSEDRIHRIGMDKNLGATIIDLVHLDTDQLVLDNLKKKRKLQSLTLGDVKAAMEAESADCN